MISMHGRPSTSPWQLRTLQRYWRARAEPPCCQRPPLTQTRSLMQQCRPLPFTALQADLPCPAPRPVAPSTPLRHPSAATRPACSPPTAHRLGLRASAHAPWLLRGRAPPRTRNTGDSPRYRSSAAASIPIWNPQFITSYVSPTPPPVHRPSHRSPRLSTPARLLLRRAATVKRRQRAVG